MRWLTLCGASKSNRNLNIPAKSRDFFIEEELVVVKFRFFVHCKSWLNGGYENAHFAKDEKEAKKIVEGWNEKARQRREAGSPIGSGEVDLLSIEEITNEEFAEDYIGML